jgi:hypothetical protein
LPEYYYDIETVPLEQYRNDSQAGFDPCKAKKISIQYQQLDRNEDNRKHNDGNEKRKNSNNNHNSRSIGANMDLNRKVNQVKSGQVKSCRSGIVHIVAK